jgi:prophage tail gpP-like protein
MDQPTYVTVLAGGMTYSAFTQVAVQYAANQAARTFALTVTDASDGWDEQWNFMPGTEITIFGNGQLVLTGYVEKMTPSYDAHDHHVEISGRSKGADTIDSSAEHPKGEFNKKTTIQIANELDKQGVGFSTDVEQKVNEVFRLNPMETVFGAVERLARKHQMLLQGMPDGSIKLTKGGTGGMNAALIEGVNILGASAIFDDSDKHSEYKVKGQKTLGVGKKSLRIEATEKDSKMKRHRPKHLHQETTLDDEGQAQKRAKHHKDRQSGESISAKVHLQSWFDDGGMIWQANALVFIESPKLKLSNMMLIKSVHLSQSENGSFTDLDLVMPEAFGGDGGGMGGSAGSGSNTSPQWG